MMKERNPDLADGFLRQLAGEEPVVAALQAAREAEREVRAAGYTQCPTWDEVWQGRRPEHNTEAEPGEWRHGWQYFAASQLENKYRESAVLTRRASAPNALLRSQAGSFRNSPNCTARGPSQNFATTAPAHSTLETTKAETTT